MRITRREALRAIGVSVALPWLPSLVTRSVFADTGEPPARPLRAAFVFVPNGAILPDWMPVKTGRDYPLPWSLEPLAPVREQVLVLTGLALDAARSKGDGPGDHARSAAAFLTCAHPKKTSGRDIRAGVSIDQVLARAVGGASKFRSLELGCTPARRAGDCDSGYSCAYTSNISWASETTPQPREVNPRLVFERLFGSEEDRRSAESRAKRLRLRKSILDYVAEDATALGKRLGVSDRAKLDEYLTAVRQVERTIQKEEASGGEAPPEMAAPRGVPRDLTAHVDLMYDLMALAFRTDSTRVATFMTADAGSNRSYPMVGVAGGHHHLSHHRGEEEKMAQVRKIDRYHVERFARFVGTLAAVGEGEGSLLDRCLIVFGSGIGDGNRHLHHDLPILLAGGGGAGVTTGRHLRHKKDTPLANLYLSIQRKMGIEHERFGDSTAPLRRV